MKNINKEPTQEIINAAKAVWLTMAAAETIKPIVEGYQKKIIERNNFQFDEKYKDIDEGKIKTLKDSWLMRDEDFKVYLKECDTEMKKAGLKVENEGDCPLLVVENLLKKAQGALIDLLEPITELTREDILCGKNGLENYNKMVELTLRWVGAYLKEKGK